MAASDRTRGRAAVNRRRLMGGAGVAGTAALLAACGPGQPAPQAGTQPASAKGPTGTVTVAQGVDANTLDPVFTNATPEFNINLQIFDTFLWRDAKTLKPTPNVLESFRLVNDTTWELKVRQGIKFHDGTPLDAEAVKFSLDRTAGIPVPGVRPELGKIGGKPIVPAFRNLVNYDAAEVVDAATVRVTLKGPSAIFPDELTSNFVVPPSQYRDEGDANLKKVAERPAGSGPYRFVEWRKDEHILLEANPDYWGPKPAFQRVYFRPVRETATRILKLQQGEADIIVNVPPDQVQVVERGGGVVSDVKGLRNIFVGIRNDRPQLADKRVRQALNYAVNFDAINRALLGGKGERMRSILNPPFTPAEAKAYSYDPNKAKQLLAEAGFPNGFSVVMDSPDGRYIKDKEMAQAIAQDLEKVGIKVELRVLEWSLYAGDKLAKRDPDDLFFLGLGAPVNGQNDLNFVHRDYSLNSTYWKNEEFHTIFDEYRRTLDEKKREEMRLRMHNLIHDDPPWIFVWKQVDFYGVSKKLTWQARADERIALREASWR
jgi:peptide/nickel transport system substrate-binding protein